MKVTSICFLLLCLVATDLTEAFQCKQCMHITTTNKDVNDVLDQAMAGVSTDEFKYTDQCHDDAGDLTSVQCAEGANACIAMRVQALMAAQDQEIEMTVVMRLCAADIKESDKGCNALSKEYEDIMTSQMGGAVDNLKDLSGVVCGCEEESCNIQGEKQLDEDTHDSAAMIPTGNPLVGILLACFLVLLFK